MRATTLTLLLATALLGCNGSPDDKPDDTGLDDPVDTGTTDTGTGDPPDTGTADTGTGDPLDTGTQDTASPDTGEPPDPDRVDDNTCDEGASAETAMRFLFANTNDAAVAGAAWAIYDLDATSGVIDPGAVATGTTGSDGAIQATLDCAQGWMLLEVAHPSYLTIHAYFMVYPVDDWQIVSMDEATATYALGWSISDPEEGLLAAYKLNPENGGYDMDGADTFSVDGGPNLVPSTASGDLGMWIFDGAYTMEMFGIWFVGADLPDHGQVAELRYEDTSNGTTTLLNAPIWSYDSGDANHHMTVFHSVY